MFNDVTHLQDILKLRLIQQLLGVFFPMQNAVVHGYSFVLSTKRTQINSCGTVVNIVQALFTQFCSSSHCYVNKDVDIDSGGYLYGH